MFLIVGLGNPGPKYEWTRHNVGFLFADALQEMLIGDGPQKRRPVSKKEFNSDALHFDVDGRKWVVAKPQTFMNLSGEAVRPFCDYYKVDVTKELLVAHDDVDLEFGQLKLQKNRGHGGQNGVRSIHQQLGHADYTRLRIGVGRPADGSPQSTADFVLSRFLPAEVEKLPEIFEFAARGVQIWSDKGFERAQEFVNQLKGIKWD